jgi:hypothetical protein
MNFKGGQPVGRKGSVLNFDWNIHLEGLNATNKEAFIKYATEIIESDPHFKEMIHVGKSMNEKTKTMASYEVDHKFIELKPDVNIAKVFLNH